MEARPDRTRHADRARCCALQEGNVKPKRLLIDEIRGLDTNLKRRGETPAQRQTIHGVGSHALHPNGL